MIGCQAFVSRTGSLRNIVSTQITQLVVVLWFVSDFFMVSYAKIDKRGNTEHKTF